MQDAGAADPHAKPGAERNDPVHAEEAEIDGSNFFIKKMIVLCAYSVRQKGTNCGGILFRHSAYCNTPLLRAVCAAMGGQPVGGVWLQVLEPTVAECSNWSTVVAGGWCGGRRAVADRAARNSGNYQEWQPRLNRAGLPE